jgi:hypothetical protein
MTKSNGIKSLKQAAKLLNRHAPDGESLAYINPDEGRLLKAHGGSGIMTLQGVPSYEKWYEKIWKGVKDVGSSILGRYTGDEGGGNVIKDLASLGGAYVGYEEAKELTEFQKKQYEKQLAEEALNELWFAGAVNEGAPLLTPQNVPSTIEDVSRFTEVDIPTMTTTAAQGGRIGYNRGRVVNPGGYNGEEDEVRLLWEKMMNGDFLTAKEKERVAMFLRNKKAQGGRIGYQEGTHPLDDVSMQIFGMTFENLNPLQQIIVTQSQQKAGGSNIEEMLNIGVTDENTIPQEVEQLLKGLRVGAQKGGIMPLLDMGGMEKDYRQDGGFVPIGRREKADDVPARLSKNEFVFTADAVKAAGGGDIDQGAQRMYNVMKNLEAGGDISEQSQGKA